VTTSAARPTFALKSFGCQMNVYDGERVAEAMAAAGWQQVDDPAGADLAILNTCHIREKATEKVYSDIGRLKRAGVARIAVAGCVAQAEGEEVLRRAPVDILVGPQALHRLPELAARPGRQVELDLPGLDKFAALPARRAAAPSAFLTIQEGCDKFCAFCVVPYTRGRQISRPAAEILAEAESLLAAGARELVLLGQNVNAWEGAAPGGGTWRLAALVRALARLGVPRIRYTTSHPRDMDDELIAAHGELPELMPFLHLPVQSGSDAMLRRMNRRHRVALFDDIVGRLRSARPDIALSSDFIVGHPGESEADFEATLALVERTGFAQAYSFKYSPRPGTPAAEAPDQLPEPVKAERLARLQALLSRQQAEFNAASVGRLVEVLLERPGRRPGQLAGRTPHMQALFVEAPGLAPGAIATVEVVRAGPHGLEGRLAAPVARAA
jgi:tRNA-2-methylthio-N6-dimethylallyladenosine synthase